MKYFYLSVLISLIAVASFANVDLQQSTSAPSTKSTTQDSKNKKMLLANELIIAMELDKNATSVINNTSSIFSRTPKANQAKNQPKIDKVYADAKVEYEKQKQNLKNNLVNNLKLLLMNSFSESELNYLVQISKYRPYIKYRNLISSEPFNKLFFEPNNKAIQMIRTMEQRSTNSADIK